MNELMKAKARATVVYLDDLMKQLDRDLNSPSEFYEDCSYKELESLVNYLEHARMAANSILIVYGCHDELETMPKVRIPQ